MELFVHFVEFLLMYVHMERGPFHDLGQSYPGPTPLLVTT